MSERLWQLADEVGIERRYWDILGNLHETSDETARTLLTALGIAAASDEEVDASLVKWQGDKWREPLPPVVIGREGVSVVVPFRLPFGSSDIGWSILFEDGGTSTGRARLDEVSIEETGTFEGRTVALRRVQLPPLPIGYHRLQIEGASTLLIVAPARCYPPPDGRRWGISAQLYALNSPSNWGMGDFGDLRTLIKRADSADAIGLNPLHALFLDAPDQASPYSPNSRLFCNPLYIDVSSVPDFAECDEARAFAATPEVCGALSAMQSAGEEQYGLVAEIKLETLRRLHRSFMDKHIARQTRRGHDYLAFVERSGEALAKFALFQTLSASLGTHDWTQWPQALRHCEPHATAAARKDHAEDISFYSFLQWLCEEQLAQAAETARRRGKAIGLYNDLAVSVDASSADHWANQNLFAADLRVGAPPDPFNERGQEWGVVPLNPNRLQVGQYAHVIDLLRANMRHAGALRIDHVMGWQRIFVIPAGAPPSAGAYLRYPLEDLMAIASLESHRNRCLIIGEDLGTVPAGFRERMTEAGILSTRVFYFENEHGRFRAPNEYPELASVTPSTHDLPTLRGYWEGEDIAAKEKLGTLDPADASQAHTRRAQERRSLLQALAEEGSLPDGLSPSEADGAAWTPALTRAVHAFLARTPSRLLMIQLDDLAGELRQANLPGSTTEYPNWRRRLSRPLADLLDDPVVRQQLTELSLERSGYR